METRDPDIIFGPVRFVLFIWSWLWELVESVLVGPVARLVAIALVTRRRPLEMFASVPGSWYRYAFCVDLKYPPELVPGMELLEKTDLKLSSFYAMGKREGKGGLLTFLTIFVTMFIASTAIRWSLKSTVIVYFPFAWIVRTSFRKLTDVHRELEEISNSRFGTLLSWGTVITFSLKVVYLALAPGLAIKWNIAAWGVSPTFAEIATTTIEPGRLPQWQIAAAILATWKISLRWLAGKAIRRRGYEDEWPTKALERVVRADPWISYPITLYTTACNLYLLLTVASKFKWYVPTIGPIVPWAT